MDPGAGHSPEDLWDQGKLAGTRDQSVETWASEDRGRPAGVRVADGDTAHVRSPSPQTKTLPASFPPDTKEVMFE